MNDLYWASLNLAPAGTTHIVSEDLVNPIATGPFLPRAPTWMCAATGESPATVTLPLTEWSSWTENEPLPLAAVFTGGTCSLPLSDTLTFLVDIMPAHPAMAM